MEQTRANQLMFESPDLTDLAFLALKGFHVVPSARRGSLQFFQVDLPADQAERALLSPERQLVGRFWEEWRKLRREIDRLQGGNGARR